MKDLVGAVIAFGGAGLATVFAARYFRLERKEPQWFSVCAGLATGAMVFTAIAALWGPILRHAFGILP